MPLPTLRLLNPQPFAPGQDGARCPCCAGLPVGQWGEGPARECWRLESSPWDSRGTREGPASDGGAADHPAPRRHPPRLTHHHGAGGVVQEVEVLSNCQQDDGDPVLGQHGPAGGRLLQTCQTPVSGPRAWLEPGTAGKGRTGNLGHPAQLQVVDVGGQGEAVRPGEDGHAGAVLRVEDLRVQHVVLQHLLCHRERELGLGRGSRGLASRCRCSGNEIAPGRREERALPCAVGRCPGSDRPHSYSEEGINPAPRPWGRLPAHS